MKLMLTSEGQWYYDGKLVVPCLPHEHCDQRIGIVEDGVFTVYKYANPIVFYDWSKIEFSHECQESLGMVGDVSLHESDLDASSIYTISENVPE